MRARDIWRTTTFRLSALYGLLFALGTAALLGLVYLQASAYLNRRIDAILGIEAASLVRYPPAELGDRIRQAVALNSGQTNIFAEFTPDRHPIIGNLARWPDGLQTEGGKVEVPPTQLFPAYARLAAFPLPSGGWLVVGRDVKVTREIRGIIRGALAWSGVLIIVMGAGFGVALSVSPIRRLRLMRDAAEAIAAGDLRRRMPITERGDELDMIAATVNTMIVEIERLMSEVKSATDSIAHDLRTPLTRARAQLHRIGTSDAPAGADLQRVTAEIDSVLDRFRALLRVSEIEAHERRSSFAPVRLADVAVRVVELYRPLAEEDGVHLSAVIEAETDEVEADDKLLFEAVSNLVDNAIKFAPSQGTVTVTVAQSKAGAQISVKDDGLGVDPGEREAVIQRFYRGGQSYAKPGSGLGLSIVSAIVRLHRFQLELSDAGPGLLATINCISPGVPERASGVARWGSRWSRARSLKRRGESQNVG